MNGRDSQEYPNIQLLLVVGSPGKDLSPSHACTCKLQVTHAVKKRREQYNTNESIRPTSIPSSSDIFPSFPTLSLIFRPVEPKHHPHLPQFPFPRAEPVVDPYQQQWRKLGKHSSTLSRHRRPRFERSSKGCQLALHTPSVLSKFFCVGQMLASTRSISPHILKTSSSMPWIWARWARFC